MENSLHYVLDAAFGEDACRIKSGNAPEKMTFIRKIALSLPQSDTESKRSVASRIKHMAWPEEYLEHLLFQSRLRGHMAQGRKPIFYKPPERGRQGGVQE
jgi:hypothetical protein